MLKELLSNRLFLGGLAFFIVTVCGSLFYMQHVVRQTAEDLADTEERRHLFYEKQKTTTALPFAKTPLHDDATLQGETDPTDNVSGILPGKTNFEENTRAEPLENSVGDDSQDPLFQQRLQQYHKDYRLWWEKYNQAYADWQQARESFQKLRAKDEEEWVKSLRNLSEVELKELHAEIQERIEKHRAAKKKASALWEEKPIYPTQ